MMKIKKDEPLAKYTTIKIGGRAKYFCVSKTIDELKTALKFAKANKLKVLILGAGSNVLISDKGFNGLVINLKGASGTLLSKFLVYCAKKGLSGLEFLAGIPGTLGGAIYMNAGAYGKNIGEMVDSVHAMDLNGKKYKFTWKQCKFGYRSSIFQKKNLIITGVEFNLKGGTLFFMNQVMKEIIRKRLSKQPYDVPSAGSFFKNPEGQHAAQLIEKAGLKGLRVGDAMVSNKHANFIVNCGNATASEVLELMKIIQKTVFSSYKIRLEPEVKIIE